MEIDSSDYGDLAVLQYAVCKLENQERNWCSSVQDQRPEKAEGGVGCTGVRPMVPRTGERGCSTQANQPFLCVFFFGPSTEWMTPTCTGEGGHHPVDVLWSVD